MVPTVSVRVAVVACCLAFPFGCGPSGSSSPATSDPEAGVYVGYIVDDNGDPVAGALVSVEGIDASAMTDSTGRFVVSDSALAVASPAVGVGVAAAVADLAVSVLAAGYAPFVGTLSVGRGDVPELDLVRDGKELSLTVTSPTGRKLFVLANGCAEPRVVVEGIVGLGSREGFRLDLVVVVDRSGSTSRPAFDVDGDGSVDSILEAQVEAVRCFLATIDRATTRVRLLAFDDETEEVVAFTNDADALGVGLDLVVAAGSGGGTNYEAALLDCREAFLELATADDESEAIEGPAEEDDGGDPRPALAVVFLTDGIPTSHGVPRNYPDAVELDGVDTFTVVDPDGGGAGTVALEIDFVFNRACYRSDFGFFVIDPANPPVSAEAALAELGPENVLFNTGDISGQNCDHGSIASGEAHYEVNANVGDVVAFFILPNRTLEDYQRDRRGSKEALVTIPALNPGAFDQVLTFRSDAGRTLPGDAATIVTPGPLTIFAFEDISIARRGADQDYDDVVWTIRDSIAGNIDGLDCE